VLITRKSHYTRYTGKKWRIIPRTAQGVCYSHHQCMQFDCLSFWYQ